MKQSSWLLLPLLALLGQPFQAADTLALAPGIELPALAATTLSGDPVTLPRDSRGHPMVLVIGFSKASSTATRPWLDRCRSASLLCYDVRMLEAVPRFVRGTVERSMRSGLPIELQRLTLLAYSDNEPWRKRLAVDDDKTAYIIACDGEGRIRAIASGELAEPKLKRILEAIASPSQ